MEPGSIQRGLLFKQILWYCKLVQASLVDNVYHVAKYFVGENLCQSELPLILHRKSFCQDSTGCCILCSIINTRRKKIPSRWCNLWNFLLAEYPATPYHSMLCEREWIHTTVASSLYSLAYAPNALTRSHFIYMYSTTLISTSWINILWQCAPSTPCLTLTTR